MCRPHFCSMKITEDVRKYPSEQQLSEVDALQAGIEQKSREFSEAGAEVYAKAKAMEKIRLHRLTASTLVHLTPPPSLSAAESAHS